MTTQLNAYNAKKHNTTNATDGHFVDLKNKLRKHNDLSIERKHKFIDELFEGLRASE